MRFDRQVKTTTPSLINYSDVMLRNKPATRNKKPRLSTITEEDSMVYFIERSRSFLACSSLVNNNNEIIWDHIVPIKKKPIVNETRSKYQQTHWLCKYSFQRDIAKTTDDHSHLRRSIHTINKQKQLCEQKVKKFLN